MRGNINQWRQQWQGRADSRHPWTGHSRPRSFHTVDRIEADAGRDNAGDTGDGPGSASKSRSRFSSRRQESRSLHPDVAAAEAAALSVLSDSTAPVPRRRERDSLHMNKSRDIFNKWETIKVSARVAPSKKRSILRSGGGNGMFAVQWSGVLMSAFLLLLIGIFAVTAEEGRKHLREKLGAGGHASAHNDSVAFASATAKSGFNGVPLPPRLERMMQKENGGKKIAEKTKQNAAVVQRIELLRHGRDSTEMVGSGHSTVQRDRLKAHSNAARQHPLTSTTASVASVSAPAGEIGALQRMKPVLLDTRKRPPPVIPIARKGLAVALGEVNNDTSSRSHLQNLTQVA
uniref:Transmembrane protein n=1 Tax=Odontella aurita TaxID=265563 RepID=A0A7S4IWU7_9STRA|mmetsp:Transcript_317/g.917  ORF Transcript_317/g.917 Transcript_317/m.917 type:complete len:345 (+) Transcript_317:28-1062(+)